MTAKDFVRVHYPLARAEKHSDNYGRKYFLIRNSSEFMYMASGDTESKAWKEAKDKINSKILKP